MTEPTLNIIENNTTAPHLADLKIISLRKFIFLSLISFGLYEIWWMFKAWRFFAIKDHLNIMPALRAIFFIFFLYSLFNRIQRYAGEQGYAQRFSTGWMYIGYLFFALIVANLPDPYWLISSLSFIFLIRAFVALNYAKTHNNAFSIILQEKFNLAQVMVIIFGSIFWLLLLIGFFMQI